MSTGKESEVLWMLQPELLSEEELIQKIQSRCCRIDKLELMSKEGLVGLFRRLLLPLPQRFYRTNRRGKMLTSRRAKAGLQGQRKDEGFAGVQPSSRVSSSGDRLKPPPDISKPHKIRIGSDEPRQRSQSGQDDLEKERLKDRRRSSADEEQRDSKMFRADLPSGRKITLKRSSGDEVIAPNSDTDRKQKAKDGHQMALMDTAPGAARDALRPARVSQRLQVEGLKDSVPRAPKTEVLEEGGPPPSATAFEAKCPPGNNNLKYKRSL